MRLSSPWNDINLPWCVNFWNQAMSIVAFSLISSGRWNGGRTLLRTKSKGNCNFQLVVWTTTVVDLEKQQSLQPFFQVCWSSALGKRIGERFQVMNMKHYSNETLNPGIELNFSFQEMCFIFSYSWLVGFYLKERWCCRLGWRSVLRWKCTVLI